MSPSGARGVANVRILGLVLASAWLVVLWFCYRGAFGAPFYGDTVYHLQERTNLHVTELSWKALWAAAHNDFGGPLYRPLSSWSLALTHYFWGLSPAAYRAGNVVIHWAATGGALFLFHEVLCSPRLRDRGLGRGQALFAAAAGAALWSLHPIQTNAVTYVIQRMASLAGLFTFLCVGAHLRARSAGAGWSWRWGLAAAFFLALALGSKESAATAVPLVVLSELVLLAPPGTPVRRRALRFAAAAAALVAVVFLVVEGPALWAHLGAGYGKLPYTVGQRLLTEARLQLQYLLVLLVPDPRLLTFDAQVEVSTGLFRPPETAAALAALAGAVVLALRSRRSHPLVCFGILWFFAAQATEATVLPLELYFEHRMYVASAPLFLGFGVFAARAVASGRLRLRVLKVGLLAAALATEAWGTVYRNALWAHPVLFWADAVAKAPGKARTHLHLAQAMIWHSFYPQAEEELQAAEALGGVSGEVAFNRGAVAYLTGHPDRAEAYLKRALDYPDIPGWLVHRRLAELRLEVGRPAEAADAARAGLRLKADDAGLWELLGQAHAALGDLRRARLCYLRSLSYDPSVRRVREALQGLEPPRAAPTARRVP